MRDDSSGPNSRPSTPAGASLSRFAADFVSMAMESAVRHNTATPPPVGSGRSSLHSLRVGLYGNTSLGGSFDGDDDGRPQLPFGFEYVEYAGVGDARMDSHGSEVALHDLDADLPDGDDELLPANLTPKKGHNKRHIIRDTESGKLFYMKAVEVREASGFRQHGKHNFGSLEAFYHTMQSEVLPGMAEEDCLEFAPVGETWFMLEKRPDACNLKQFLERIADGTISQDELAAGLYDGKLSGLAEAIALKVLLVDSDNKLENYIVYKKSDGKFVVYGVDAEMLFTRSPLNMWEDGTEVTSELMVNYINDMRNTQNDVFRSLLLSMVDADAARGMLYNEDVGQMIQASALALLKGECKARFGHCFNFDAKCEGSRSVSPERADLVGADEDMSASRLPILTGRRLLLNGVVGHADRLSRQGTGDSNTPGQTPRSGGSSRR